MTLVWTDPRYEEFQCAGCYGPAFRLRPEERGRGRVPEYCCDACQRATHYRNRRDRAGAGETGRA